MPNTLQWCLLQCMDWMRHQTRSPPTNTRHEKLKPQRLLKRSESMQHAYPSHTEQPFAPSPPTRSQDPHSSSPGFHFNMKSALIMWGPRFSMVQLYIHAIHAALKVQPQKKLPLKWCGHTCKPSSLLLSIAFHFWGLTLSSWTRCHAHDRHNKTWGELKQCQNPQHHTLSCSVELHHDALRVAESKNTSTTGVASSGFCYRNGTGISMWPVSIMYSYDARLEYLLLAKRLGWAASQMFRSLSTLHLQRRLHISNTHQTGTPCDRQKLLTNALHQSPFQKEFTFAK